MVEGLSNVINMYSDPVRFPTLHLLNGLAALGVVGCDLLEKTVHILGARRKYTILLIIGRRMCDNDDSYTSFLFVVYQHVSHDQLRGMVDNVWINERGGVLLSLKQSSNPLSLSLSLSLSVNSLGPKDDLYEIQKPAPKCPNVDD